MGLLDSILGGTPDNSGLSAATKALLLVLAAKAAKDYLTHHQQTPQAPGAEVPAGAGGLGGILGSMLGGGQTAPGASGSAVGGGGLGGMLGSLLGGGQAGVSGASGAAPGGAGLGGLISGLGGAGVLGALVDQFRQNGHGAAMDSWIGNGSNQPIAPAQLGQALGPAPLKELEAKTGLPQQTLLEQLAHELPAAMDHFTPQGRLPTDDEVTANAQGGARP